MNSNDRKKRAATTRTAPIQPAADRKEAAETLEVNLQQESEEIDRKPRRRGEGTEKVEA
jgi:hypothetical protein